MHGVSAATMAAGSLSFRDLLSVQADELRRQGRSMILLWMSGGPSQLETFDPKPGTENGGPTQAIQTSVAGIEIAEAWPQTAKIMEHLALIRSMTNKAGNHQRASYQLHTGYIPSGNVKHPSLAASIANQIAPTDFDLPTDTTAGRSKSVGAI